MKICGIYQIKNIINNKIYVGQSVDIKRRWNDHKNTLKKNKHDNLHLQSSWNKYGEESFEFIILEEVERDKEKLKEREQFWINQLDCANDSKGYNISPTACTTLGVKFSDKVRKQMSESGKNKIFTEEHKQNLSLSGKGRKFSEKHRQNLSLAKRNLSDECRKNMSNGQKRRIRTEEEINNMKTYARNNKGKKRSPEIIAKQKETRKKNNKPIPPISKETRQKISESHKKNKKNVGENNPFYGKKHSVETLQKLREAGKGKKQSPETISKRVETRKRNKELREQLKQEKNQNNGANNESTNSL